MATYRTDICTAAANAPSVTYLYAKCQVCGVEWQVRSPTRADAQGCSFCDAPAEAITVISEAADYGGHVVG